MVSTNLDKQPSIKEEWHIRCHLSRWKFYRVLAIVHEKSVYYLGLCSNTHLVHQLRIRMDIFWKKWRRRYLSRITICLMCLCAPIVCLIYLIYSDLPDVSLSRRTLESRKPLISSKTVEGLGELGGMMVAMLPDDLAFTIFVPSEEAFQHSLKLRSHDSLKKDKYNETYAIISRVMGFSTVPQHILSDAIPSHKEIAFDSVSGLRLYAWKDFDGTLVVNGVRSASVDIIKSEIIVHKMKGVLMDAEFEQSFPTDDED